MDTDHKRTPRDELSKFTVDIDLSVLGKPLKEFKSYEEGVRKEYSWVPKELFARGRREIIQSFLDREFIYFTDFFRRNYESQARSNLQDSLTELKP